MDDIVDLLKIKIEQAKKLLPRETLDAISVVDWRQAILDMRNKHGFSFEQLGDLELETELVFCGLISPKDYPVELEKRMHISKVQAQELVNEMNELVFKKIRAELIKNTERQRIFSKKIDEEKKQQEVDNQILHKAGIKILDKDTEIKADLSIPELEEGHPEIKDSPVNIQTEKITSVPMKNLDIEIEKPKEESHPILAQKLTKPVQVNRVKTDYTIEKITPPEKTEPVATRKVDPYREIPE